MIGSVQVVTVRYAGTEEGTVRSPVASSLDSGEERRAPSDAAPRKCATATGLDVVVLRKEWGAPGRVPQGAAGGGGGGGTVKLGITVRK